MPDIQTFATSHASYRIAGALVLVTSMVFGCSASWRPAYPPAPAVTQAAASDGPAASESTQARVRVVAVRRHTDGLYVDALVSGTPENSRRTQYAHQLDYYIARDPSRYVHICNTRTGLTIPVAAYRTPGGSLFSFTTWAPPPNTVLQDGRIVQTLMLYAPGLSQSLGAQDSVDVRFTDEFFQGRVAELFATDTDWRTFEVSDIGPA